ncbi:MAG: hypothetical protein ACK4N4_14255 [Burkholderiales bacterium]
MRMMVGMLAALLASAAQGEVLKCVDGAGKLVEYASVCPAGTRAQATGIRSAPEAPAQSRKPLAERDAEFRKRAAEQREAERKQENAVEENELRRRNCERARAYLKSLQSGSRIVRIDPATGERVFLEDKDFPQEIADARRAIEANCK